MRNTRLAPGCDVLGVALCVGRREIAAGVAGARNEAGTDRVRLDGEPERLDPLLRFRKLFGRNARDQKILPDRQPQIAVAQVARDGGEPVHLHDRHPPDRQHDADPVQPLLLLRMDADVRGAIERRPRRHCARHCAIEFAAELLLEQSDEFLDAHGLEHVFEPRLVAIGAVAMLDEKPHHRIGDFAGVLWLDENAGVAGKIVMPSDAAQAQLEPDAGRKPRALVHLHCLEADVVRIFQHRNRAGAVEGDIEFAWQAVKRAIVENMEMPLARERAACR